MISLDRIVAMVILVWILVYTGSYGLWTWRKKNRLGAAAVFIVALAAVVLPIYAIFFREG
jgi:predicted membrane channel-forming protein YqfA (hemolysin III family)